MFSRAQLAGSDRRWAVKLALRAFTIVVSLIALSCHAWIITGTGTAYFANWTPGWILGLVITASASIVWSLANIAVSLIRSKPMHPGANVGCDLVLWIFYTMASVITSYPVWGFYSGYGPYSSYYYNSSYSSSSSSSIAYARQRKKALLVFNIRAAGAVFAYIAVLLHLTLFIMACRDCERHNKSKRDWQATKVAENIINGMDQRYTIAHGQPIYAPISQIYGIDAQQPTQQPPFRQQQTQYQGPEMPKYGAGYMAVPQQAALHPPPPGTVGSEVGRGGNFI